jgi:hypothetical protein
MKRRTSETTSYKTDWLTGARFRPARALSYTYAEEDPVRIKKQEVQYKTITNILNVLRSLTRAELTPTVEEADLRMASISV